MSMTAIEPAANAWAYPEIEADYKACRNVWREVSQSFYDENLGVLPPVYVEGGFMVGEPLRHTANGGVVAALFATVQGRYFARVAEEHGAGQDVKNLRSLFAPVSR